MVVRPVNQSLVKENFAAMHLFVYFNMTLHSLTITLLNTIIVEGVTTQRNIKSKEEISLIFKI